MTRNYARRRVLWLFAGTLAALSACASGYELAVSQAGGPLPLISLVCSMGATFLAAYAAWGPSRPAPAGTRGGERERDHLSARLLAVQEEERKNLSRELHDGVGQTVTALKMELGRIKSIANEGDSERLERARTLADEVLNTIRNVSLLLRPPALDDLGLEAALRWHVEDFTRRTSIRCRLACSLREDRLLPEAVKTCIYRTVQEALNNTEKHSGARNIEVEVRQNPSGILVSIADDGKGLQQPYPEAAGLGILGMRERASMLGGSFKLESAPGQGAKVTLSLPSNSSSTSEGPKPA